MERSTEVIFTNFPQILMEITKYHRVNVGLILLILIVSGATRCVYNEGMPIYRNPFEKGNLYVKFELTFPPNQFANEKQLKVCMRKTCFPQEFFFQITGCKRNPLDIVLTNYKKYKGSAKFVVSINNL